MNQKGYLIFSPGSRQILLSDDVIFDDGFSSAITTTWQQHKDSLAIQPINSYIPDVTTTMEHIGTIADLIPTPVEEGRNNSNPNFTKKEDGEDDTPSLCDAVDDDFDKYDDEEVPTTFKQPHEDSETPIAVDSSTTL
jgi:hypothetical protein